MSLTPGPPREPRKLDVKLALHGTFYSRAPEEVLYPVKVLFVVDTSQSMNVTDPIDSASGMTGRARAIEAVARRILGPPGVSVALVAFNGGASILTQIDTNGDREPDADGFSSDLNQVLGGVAELNFAGGTTSYEGALGVAHQLLAADMDRSERLSRSRAKYVVIFHSDGLPNPVSVGSNDRPTILRRVEEIRELVNTFAVRELTLHTTYLSYNTPPTVKEEATALLRSMAERGGGTFRNFDHGEQINFLSLDYTAIRRQFTLKSFLASNLSARPIHLTPELDRDGDGLDDAREERLGLDPLAPDTDGDRIDDLREYLQDHPEYDRRIRPDSDGDGLDDDRERSIGSDPTRVDTDGDGFGDLLEHLLMNSGYDPLDPHDADCLLPQDREDDDGDGLRNCEERYLGTSPELFDSDADGFPDPVELGLGTNPVFNDVLADPDFDGARNGDELRAHSDPARPDAADLAEIGYRYRLRSEWIMGEECPAGLPGLILTEAAAQASRRCLRYEFDVWNITLVPTLQAEGAADPGTNELRLYVIETPFDDPLDFGVIRVACLRPRLVLRSTAEGVVADRLPASGLLDLPAGYFVDPATFEPSRDCVEMR